VHEIERHRESLLIVGHQGVLRMLLAYYQGVPREQAPYLELALNHVHAVLMLARKGALLYNPSKQINTLTNA
jgi:broad specificity phosphatase PhoE